MAIGVNEITDIANSRTGRKAEGKLNLVREFWIAFNEFVLENHFWWRRKTATFTVTATSQTSDLAAAGLTDLYEIDELYRVEGGGLCPVLPMADAKDKVAALLATTAEPPAYFTSESGLPQTIRFQAPSDAAYTLVVSYWALVDINVDSAVQDVPLIPPGLTYGLPSMLERHILAFLYGENDERFVIANQAYQRFVGKCARSKDISRAVQLSLGSVADAVRAT